MLQLTTLLHWHRVKEHVYDLALDEDLEGDEACLGLGLMSHTLVVGPALHVDQLTLRQSGELHSNQRGVVFVLVALEGEVLGLEPSGFGEVLNTGQSLLVGWVPSLAVHPDLLLVALTLPVVMEALRPLVLGEVLLSDGGGGPAPDLVEFQEDARLDQTLERFAGDILDSAIFESCQAREDDTESA